MIVLFATISTIALAGTLVLSTWCFRRIDLNRSKRNTTNESEKDSIEPDDPGPIDWDNMAALLIIEHDELSLERELGAGAFGRVFAGYWKPKNYAQDEDKKGKLKKKLRA